MIGTNYTPGLLAELAKKPNVRSLEIPVTPKGGLDKISIVLSPATSVELKSEIGAVSVIKEKDTTSDEPWLVIVEPC